MATDTSTGGQGQQMAGQAQEKAQQAAGQAQDKAHQAAGQAKDQLKTQVDQRSTQAGQQVSQQASDVRSISSQLREQGKDKPAEYVDKAADRAEQLGGYLERSDADTILHDVENLARRQPLAVLGGGLVLGVMASRFLKASSSKRFEASSAARAPRYDTRPSYGAPALPPTNGLDRPVVVETQYGTGGALGDTPNTLAGGVTTPAAVDPLGSPTADRPRGDVG